MKKFVFLVFIFPLLLFSGCLGSTVDSNEFRIINNTGYTVLYIYMTPTSYDVWGTDLLGEEVLLAGEAFIASLNDYSESEFDLKVIDIDGDEYVFFNIDTNTTHSMTVELENLRVP